MVALLLDNSAAKTCLCKQGGTSSPFLSGIACHIFNLANILGINLLPLYILTHLDMEADYHSWERLVSEQYLPPLPGSVSNST